MPDAASRIVIIGAGHAGGALAALLRQFGFTGAITLIGDEPVAPYQRPPLSKSWLSGETGIDKALLRPHAWYESANVDLRLGATALRIDPAARTVTLSDGDTISYDALILATGAAPRMTGVEGEHLAGIFSLRTAADAENIKAAILPGGTAALIGAGYIGLELAASLTKAGMRAVVIEREARAVARVASPPIAAFLEAEHRARGVEFRFLSGLERFVGDSAVRAVQLQGGETIACDLAVVGIGVVPNDALAREAGLDCANGVVVDKDVRTSDPAIFAIGDIAYRPLPHYDRAGRLESVPNALEQARHVAAILCGRPAPAAEVPWFWSDQYDLKIQIAGLTMDCDSNVLRGDPAARSFAVFHLRGGVIRAVEAINAPPEFMIGRKLIAARAAIPAGVLADPGVSLKELASG